MKIRNSVVYDILHCCRFPTILIVCSEQPAVCKYDLANSTGLTFGTEEVSMCDLISDSVYIFRVTTSIILSYYVL